MKRNNYLKIISVAVISCAAISGTVALTSKEYVKKTEVHGYTNRDGATYYNSISANATGTSLLSSLQTLNSSKRQKTPGYKQLWNYYGETDYDPANPNKYIAFYQGTSASKGEMNKEHVWPNSRGGGLVEGDIHMPRPTLTSDNSSRGNSFYVEGKNSTTAGWDPKADGLNETYRGDSARIIFYCCVANSTLSLVDKENDSTSNKTMGKLSDLLKWNLQYPVLDRENRRNEGAELVQGNRNPFIDHPEYACKIWGNTNETTKKICAAYDDPPTKLTMSQTTATLIQGGTVNLSVNPTPSTAPNSVTWKSSNISVANVNDDGKVTAISTGTATITATSTLDTNIYASCEVSVKSVSSIALKGTAQKTVYKEGDSFDPTGITIAVTYSDGGTNSVEGKEGTWTPSQLATTTTEVTCTYGGKTAIYTGITVNKSQTAVAVTGIEVPEEIELTEGNSTTLQYTIKPADATNKSVSFATSDQTIAFVNMDGLITAIKEGEATVTVTTTDGNHQGSTKVKVKKSENGAGGTSFNMTGCEGSIIPLSIGLISLSSLLLTFLLIKKRKEN